MAQTKLTIRSEIERYFPDRRQRHALLEIVADTIDRFNAVAPAVRFCTSDRNGPVPRHF